MYVVCCDCLYVTGNSKYKKVNTEVDQEIGNDLHPPEYECYMDPDCNEFGGIGDCCFFPELFFINDLGLCCPW